MATIAEENIIIDFQVRTDGLQVASKSVAALNTDAKKLEDTLAKGIGAGFDSKSIAQKLLAVENSVKRIDTAVKKAAGGDLSALEKEFNDIAKAAHLTNEELEYLVKNGDKVAKELASLGNIKLPDAGGGGFFGRIKEFALGGVIANGITGIASALGGVAKRALDVSIQAEQTKIAFETFLGSADKADNLIAKLNEFSNATPFEPQQVNTAGKALLAFGIEADELIPKLTAIGDISSGTGKDFNELAVIFGKAKVAGTLFAEDINQLTEAGIPVIQEFAKQLGVSESEVKKLGSEGKISFKNLEQAFTDLTSEGGKFAGLMEAQSQSLGGLFSTLSGEFDATLRTFGDALLPFIKSLTIGLIDVLAGVRGFIQGLAEIPRFINENKETIIALGVALIGFNTNLIISNALLLKNTAITKAKVIQDTILAARLTLIRNAQLLWNAALLANPIGLIVGAVALLVAGLIVLSNKVEVVRNIFGGLTEVFKDVLVYLIQIPAKIQSVFKDGFVSGIKNIFTSIKQGFVDGLKGVTEGFEDILQGNIFEGLKKIALNLLLTNPLTKAFFNLGKSVIDSFKKGFDANKLQETLKKVTGAGGGSARNDPKRFQNAESENDAKKIKSNDAVKKGNAKGKGTGDDTLKKELQAKLDAEALKFQIEENNARRTIKNEQELEKKLKEIELRKQLALAEIRKKYAKVGTLAFEEEVGKILEINAQLEKLLGGTIEFDIKVNAPSPESVIDLTKNIIAKEEDIDEVLRQATEKLNRSIEEYNAEKEGKQNILVAVKTGDSNTIDKAKSDEGLKQSERNLARLKQQRDDYLVSAESTAEGLFDLDLKILDAQTDLQEKENDRKKKDAQDEKERLEAQKQAALELIANAKAVTDAVLTEAIRRKDGEIKIQQERLNALLGNIDKGNTEQVQLEEERLKKLTEEREKYAQAQRRIAAIEIAINTALAASQAITAITAAFKEGNIFKGIATSLALAAQVAATIISVRNAFSNLPTYRQGTERTGKGNVDGYGGFNAVLHPDERVLTAEQNAPLLKYGIKNTDVPKLALLGLGMKKYGSQTATMDMSKMEKIMKEQNTKLDRITEVLQNTGMDVSISDEGILNMTNRAKDRMDKAKRMRR